MTSPGNDPETTTDAEHTAIIEHASQDTRDAEHQLRTAARPRHSGRRPESGMTARRPGCAAAGSAPQDITDPATGGSRLLSQRCATCILGAGDKMHLGPARLRAIIDEALAAGTFVVCHDTLTYGDFPDYGPAICRGFFDAHAGRSPALIFLRAWRRLVEVPPPGSGSPLPPPAARSGPQPRQDPAPGPWAAG